MKKRKLFIRIMCIVLCAIMILGIIVVGVSTVFGAEEEPLIMPSPDTGSGSEIITIVIVALLVVAAIIAIACVATSKKKNKK